MQRMIRTNISKALPILKVTDLYIYTQISSSSQISTLYLVTIVHELFTTISIYDESTLHTLQILENTKSIVKDLLNKTTNTVFETLYFLGKYK